MQRVDDLIEAIDRFECDRVKDLLVANVDINTPAPKAFKFTAWERLLGKAIRYCLHQETYVISFQIMFLSMLEFKPDFSKLKEDYPDLKNFPVSKLIKYYYAHQTKPSITTEEARLYLDVVKDIEKCTGMVPEQFVAKTAKLINILKLHEDKHDNLKAYVDIADTILNQFLRKNSLDEALYWFELISTLDPEAVLSRSKLFDGALTLPDSLTFRHVFLFVKQFNKEKKQFDEISIVEPSYQRSFFKDYDKLDPERNNHLPHDLKEALQSNNPNHAISAYMRLELEPEYSEYAALGLLRSYCWRYDKDQNKEQKFLKLALETYQRIIQNHYDKFKKTPILREYLLRAFLWLHQQVDIQKDLLNQILFEQFKRELACKPICLKMMLNFFHIFKQNNLLNSERISQFLHAYLDFTEENIFAHHSYLRRAWINQVILLIPHINDLKEQVELLARILKIYIDELHQAFPCEKVLDLLFGKLRDNRIFEQTDILNSVINHLIASYDKNSIYKIAVVIKQLDALQPYVKSKDQPFFNQTLFDCLTDDPHYLPRAALIAPSISPSPKVTRILVDYAEKTKDFKDYKNAADAGDVNSLLKMAQYFEKDRNLTEAVNCYCKAYDVLIKTNDIKNTIESIKQIFYFLVSAGGVLENQDKIRIKKCIVDLFEKLIQKNNENQQHLINKPSEVVTELWQLAQENLPKIKAFIAIDEVIDMLNKYYHQNEPFLQFATKHCEGDKFANQLIEIRRLKQQVDKLINDEKTPGMVVQKVFAFLLEVKSLDDLSSVYQYAREKVNESLGKIVFSCMDDLGILFQCDHPQLIKLRDYWSTNLQNKLENIPKSHPSLFIKWLEIRILFDRNVPKQWAEEQIYNTRVLQEFGLCLAETTIESYLHPYFSLEAARALNKIIKDHQYRLNIFQLINLNCLPAIVALLSQQKPKLSDETKLYLYSILLILANDNNAFYKSLDAKIQEIKIRPFVEVAHKFIAMLCKPGNKLQKLALWYQTAIDKSQLQEMPVHPHAFLLSQLELVTGKDGIQPKFFEGMFSALGISNSGEQQEWLARLHQLNDMTKKIKDSLTPVPSAPPKLEEKLHRPEVLHSTALVAEVGTTCGDEESTSGTKVIDMPNVNYYELIHSMIIASACAPLREPETEIEGDRGDCKRTPLESVPDENLLVENLSTVMPDEVKERKSSIPCTSDSKSTDAMVRSQLFSSSTCENQQTPAPELIHPEITLTSVLVTPEKKGDTSNVDQPPIKITSSDIFSLRVEANPKFLVIEHGLFKVSIPNDSNFRIEYVNPPVMGLMPDG